MERRQKNQVAGVMLVTLGMIAGCGGDGDGGSTNPLCTGDASSPATVLGAKVKAIQDVSATLAAEANKIDQESLKTCQNMAADLMIPAAELVVPPMSTLTLTEVVCSRVKLELDKLIKENLPANVSLTINFTPVNCAIEASVVQTCVEKCDKKEVQRTRVECEPGHLSGSCGASCTGECSGSCTGMCSGTCTGSCSGTCTGACEGTCNGTCSVALGADGKCGGTCTGTCSGSCTGSCSAGCTGSCSAQCTGSCSAQCTGSCSVAFQAPKCEKFVYTEVVEECKTTCDAEANAKAECTPPKLTVELLTSISPAKEAKVKLAVNTLKKNLPTILKLSYRTGTVLSASVGAYATAINGVINNAAGAVVETTACLGGAVSATARALGQVNVSFTASASISASASAMGTATTN